MTAFDDLSLLRAFVRIVESGNISAAARTLKMPQPTLSRHLRTLEERSGATLLQRDTHHLHLTEAGRQFLSDAQALLELADQAGSRLRDERKALRGHLRVFATIDLGQTSVTRLLARFLRQNPGVTAELSYTNRPVQMIEEGYDVGVVAGSLTDERVVLRAVSTVLRYVLGAPELVSHRPTPREPQDLNSWPWVALSGKQFGGTSDAVTLVSQNGGATVLRISPLLISEGVTSLRVAVRDSLGIAVLPEWLVAEDLASGKLLRLLPDWSASDIPLNLIYLARRATPLRVRALLDFMAASLPVELARVSGSRRPGQ
jgi:DNA-binding transcriptional LysR family regulator